MKYLIVPSDCDVDELVVYSWLYKHSNQTKENYDGLKKNEVYFSNRLISEYTNLDKMKVNRSLKRLEEKQYIRIMYKSKSKKQPSKCFLSFNNNLKNDTVVDTVCNTVNDTVQSIENTKVVNNYKTVNDTVSVTDSDTKSINIIYKYNLIYNTWLKADIVKHKNLTVVMKKNIDKILKKYSIDDIVLAINRYCEMYKSEYPYCNYKWTLNEFLTREKGIGYFLDDGDKWINYNEWKQGSSIEIDGLDLETRKLLEERKRAMEGLY
ncbi:helix-turn-helix domain-containing protein [Clostridium botulinum]|uniref:helix-turn-helix domain-containing protein n=1 Tax=Clostridium botulinum TaxID=1491 RepID=UPI002148CA2C|nr:helix-turn-helix domain-containing protein [Clostridium botulinum]MCR1167340.1 helix-turn-helix domain-containing protein [Clostridium botulinum]